MAGSETVSGIDEYLLKRLMPVEGAIPHLQGIEVYLAERSMIALVVLSRSMPAA